ncbi:hypothetical protein EJ06DRAFT_530196 [Trichodelitschia bisporula]|uniref:Uncharacterized protein n=1 Tax=Trichodelitschia bisporula TaxID=703511 RepID=A0A6G1HW11_9PEZI|nr:hypothetical protein EJ06DRAFT_530196 [Trichodelitschia bisporula]
MGGKTSRTSRPPTPLHHELNSALSRLPRMRQPRYHPIRVPHKPARHHPISRTTSPPPPYGCTTIPSPTFHPGMPRSPTHRAHPPSLRTNTQTQPPFSTPRHQVRLATAIPPSKTQRGEDLRR